MPVNILMVDDREENLLALEAVLSSPQYHLVRASSGQEALNRIQERDYALILLDVQMPGMDGFETAKRIRTGNTGADTPIIFLTAINHEDRNIHAGYDSGAVDYLFKPFDIVILRSKVAVFADLFRKGRKIREQEVLLQKLYERSETRFRAFFDQSSLPMLVFSPDGTCVEANRAAEDIVGMSKELPPHASILNDPRLREYAQAGLSGKAVQIPPFLYEPGLTEKPGRARWLETSVYPVTDHNEKVRELALVMKDVTDRVIEQSALEKAVSARDEFLSIASHELRTPITSMTLSNQMVSRQLDREGLTAVPVERVLKLTEQSGRQLERLTRLIEDMLDISRINTGKFAMKLEQVRLVDLAREVVERLMPQLGRAGCNAAVHAEEMEADIGVICDRFRIEQAISNLIVNSLRYGPGKPIEIRVGKHQAMATISVRDEGMGIAPEDQRRIFERFERAISVNEVSGLGLGLYIVRQIMTAHGGGVRVHSEAGRGATFTLELPLERPENHA